MRHWSWCCPRQRTPAPIQQRQIEEERRQQEQERLQRRPATEPVKRDALRPPAAGPVSDAMRFVVREVEFTPLEILGKDELEGVARDYRGKQLPFADLRQLAERVNALYRAKGVVTAQALIPPQDVTDGLVLVRLVASRLGSIRIDGNDSTSAGLVTWRLGQTPGQLVDLQALERELVWAGELRHHVRACVCHETSELHRRSRHAAPGAGSRRRVVGARQPFAEAHGQRPAAFE